MSDDLDGLRVSVAAARARIAERQAARNAHKAESLALLAFHLDGTKYVLDADQVAAMVLELIEQGKIPHVRANY